VHSISELDIRPEQENSSDQSSPAIKMSNEATNYTQCLVCSRQSYSPVTRTSNTVTDSSPGASKPCCSIYHLFQCAKNWTTRGHLTTVKSLMEWTGLSRGYWWSYALNWCKPNNDDDENSLVVNQNKKEVDNK